MDLTRKRVVLLGDSLAEGLSEPLGAIVKRLGASFSSIGIPGIGMRAFVESQNARLFVEDNRPSLVVVVLGTNDLTHSDEHIRAAVVDVLAQCSTISPLPAISWWAPPHYASDRLNSLSPRVTNIIRGVTARTAGSMTIDSVPLTEFAEKSGSFHFTARGYKWWAEAGMAATVPDGIIGPDEIVFDTTWGTDVKLGRVPWGFMVALAMEESGLNPRIRHGGASFQTNPWGATGMWQIMPRHVPAYNRASGENISAPDLLDPEVSKRVAAWMMNGVLERWDREPYLLADWFSPRFIGLFAMAWNMGPGAVEEATSKLKARQYVEAQVNIETVWHSSPPAYRHPTERDSEGRTRLRFAHKVVDDYFKGPVGARVPIEELARGPRGAARIARAGMGGGGAVLALGAAGVGAAVLLGGGKKKGRKDR